MLSSFVGFVGLPNVDNRCYINCVVQCLYMTVGFREFILNLHIDDDQFNNSALKELKKLFVKLQVMYEKYHQKKVKHQNIKQLF